MRPDRWDYISLMACGFAVVIGCRGLLKGIDASKPTDQTSAQTTGIQGDSNRVTNVSFQGASYAPWALFGASTLGWGVAGWSRRRHRQALDRAIDGIEEAENAMGGVVQILESKDSTEPARLVGSCLRHSGAKAQVRRHGRDRVERLLHRRVVKLTKV